MKKVLFGLVALGLSIHQVCAADNYTATPGSGLTFAAKDNGSAVLFSRFIGCDNTTTTQCWAIDASGRLTVNLASGGTVTANLGTLNGASTAANQTGPNTASVTNPPSTLTMTATTTAFGAQTYIAPNSGNPSFAIANSAGAARITRLRLSNNDTTSTGWPSAQIQVDLWSAAPTFTNADRGAWLPSTGAATHLGAFSCTMSAIWGDGSSAECYPLVGNDVAVKLGSGTSIYWSLQAVNGSGVTGQSKVWTLAAEVTN